MAGCLARKVWRVAAAFATAKTEVSIAATEQPNTATSTAPVHLVRIAVGSSRVRRCSSVPLPTQAVDRTLKAWKVRMVEAE